MGTPRHNLKKQCVCVLSILLIVSSKSTATCRSWGAGSFLTHPTDQTVKEGQNATFLCAVRSLDFDNFELTWNVHPDKYDRDTYTALVRDRFEITSRTTVYRVGKTVQAFQCILKFSNENSERCSLSRVAKTNVQFFPKYGQLSCGPRLIDGFHEGEIISLRCASPRGNPPVDLRLTYDDNRDIAFPVLHENGLLRIIEVNLAITRDLHLKKMLCQATSAVAFPGEILRCSVGPILVLQVPQVFIYPALANIEATRDGSIRFECIAKGFPENFTYRWSCISEETSNQCESSTNILELHIASNERTSSTLRKVNITCNVLNSVGFSTNSSKLIIHPVGHYNETCDESENDGNQFLHLDLKASKVFDHSLEFSCFLIVPVDNVDVKFKLYLEGTLLTSIRKNVTVASLPLFGINLNYNATTSDEGKVVFCKVEGLVGMNYITWGICSVVVANGETKIQWQISEGLPDHTNTFPPQTSVNKNENATGFNRKSTYSLNVGLYTKIPDVALTKDTDDIDSTKIIHLSTYTDTTEMINNLFILEYSDVLVSGAVVIIIVIFVVAAFIILSHRLKKQRDITAIEATGVSASDTKASDDCACIDPFYEMPNVQGDNTTEEIALQDYNSSLSDSLDSIYSGGNSCSLDTSSSC